MLRTSVLLAMALAAVCAHAQVSGDPLAAAPAVFETVPADSGAGAGMSVDGVMGAPAQGAQADQQPMQGDQQPMDYADTGDYAGVDYQYPAYDAPDYDAPYYYAPPPFYLGVSLLPYDYWYPGFGFGYGYGFVSFGFGFGFPFWGFGGHFYGHHYYAWNGNHWNGWNSFHGPYRYFGGGRYADHFHAGAGAGFAHTAASFSNRGGTFAGSSHAGSAAFARGAVANTSRGNFGVGRTTLPSSSYYATSQRTNFATGRATYNANTVRGATFGPGARATGNVGGQRNWVASMPNRGYAATPSRGNVNTQYSRGNSSGYAMQRNYAGPRNYATPQQRYNGAPSSRAYYGGHVPSASYSHSSAPTRSSGGGNGGGHESEGSGSHRH